VFVSGGALPNATPKPRPRDERSSEVLLFPILRTRRLAPLFLSLSLEREEFCLESKEKAGVKPPLSRSLLDLPHCSETDSNHPEEEVSTARRRAGSACRMRSKLFLSCLDHETL